MPTTSFYLKDSVIYASVSQGKSQRYRISTYQKIESNYWDKKKNRVRSTYENSTYINELLSKVETLIEKLAIEKQFIYTAADIRQELAEKIFKNKITVTSNSTQSQPKNSQCFITYFENYIKRNPMKSVGGTIPTMKTTLFNLKQFIKYANKDYLLLSQIDAKFEREFKEFIFDYKGLKINSYYTYMATMIPVLKYALEEKVLTDRSFLSFKHKPQQADKFALTEEEINRIWSVETNYKVREYCKMLFVFCCSSGLRYPSDIMRLDIDKNLVFDKELERYFIEIYPKKQLNTNKKNKKTYIPIDERALYIFSQVKKFRKIEHHTYVDNLRKLAEQAGLTRNINYVDNENGIQVIKDARLCDLIVPHVARYSFFSNAKRNNVSSELLSSITQLSQATINKYYDQSSSEDAAKIIIRKGLM